MKDEDETLARYRDMAKRPWEYPAAALSAALAGVIMLMDVRETEQKAALGSADAIASPRTSRAAPADPVAFQPRVLPWLIECFGERIAGDTSERCHRFLEEAIELVQSGGCTASEAHQLVDYVYGRPVGDMAQEVGGVMVTLAALCLAYGLDMHEAAETKLARVWTKVDAIRTKHAAKPKHSPLPQHVEPAPVVEPVASIVPDGCTGITIVFEPGHLHVNKDGWGYFCVPDAELVFEDDRCMGPDGSEGSIHWIARMDASEIEALRDFLNGAPRAAQTTPPAPASIADLIETAQWARNRLDRIADDCWHGDARDFKRSLIGVFADFDRALRECGSTMPPEIAALRAQTTPPDEVGALIDKAKWDQAIDDLFYDSKADAQHPDTMRLNDWAGWATIADLRAWIESCMDSVIAKQGGAE